MDKQLIITVIANEERVRQSANIKVRLFNILIILTVLLITSCSPQRRLHRLITKHPELTQMDTIVFTDTTIIPEVRIDTIVHHSALKDTVIITKDKLKLQLIEINDTIYIEAHHEPDTIIITKEIPVERIIHIEPENKFLKFCNGFKYNFLIYIILLVLVFSL